MFSKLSLFKIEYSINIKTQCLKNIQIYSKPHFHIFTRKKGPLPLLPESPESLKNLALSLPDCYPPNSEAYLDIHCQKKSQTKKYLFMTKLSLLTHCFKPQGRYFVIKSFKYPFEIFQKQKNIYVLLLLTQYFKKIAYSKSKLES